MAIVKELNHGPCKIYIHDDCVVKTEEEKQAIIDRVSQIIIRGLAEKAKDETV